MYHFIKKKFPVGKVIKTNFKLKDFTNNTTDKKVHHLMQQLYRRQITATYITNYKPKRTQVNMINA